VVLTKFTQNAKINNACVIYTTIVKPKRGVELTVPVSSYHIRVPHYI